MKWHTSPDGNGDAATLLNGSWGSGDAGSTESGSDDGGEFHGDGVIIGR